MKEQHVRRRSEELVYDVAVHDIIKEGNLGTLVDHLTDPERSEPTFSDVFFLTYSTFTTASELFTILVERARETQFDQRSQEVIRTRTIAALTSWFERYWGESNSPETTQELRRMHGQVQQCSEIMDNAASSRLLAAMEQRLTGNEPTRRVVTPPSNTQPPSPITPKSMKKMKLGEIDPTEMARQLTILESQLYCRIRHLDWLNKAWTTEAHTGINAMILHSNQLANWVVEVILGQCDMKRRVGMMKYFIQVAEKCRELNNYATLMSIISGLGTTPVFRLYLHWNQVSRKAMASLENLRHLMSSERNFVRYRESLRTSPPPCIPFIGIFLTDLVFLEDGIPNQTPSGVINFGKRAKVAEVLREIQHHQRTPHYFLPVPELQDMIQKGLQNAGKLDDTYDQSLEIEPRRQGEENLPGRDRYAATGSHMTSVLIASMAMR
ncbi:ras GEF [Aspergillus campestris IBT 28561]|uniref:Ras GEF n=1 Tax=Aspergillus campestris (strain IBT 28561) TaxID=1392248 RepID=A0A2I1CSV8_ASPC2|nr:ras GEF [Aspergillus campestris IBT 28561]PKY00704.1 ras GEF [Aspergillus campestris IBT 28561]